MSIEIWKSIYDGDYDISNYGNMRSFIHSSGRRKTPFYLKGFLNKGYKFYMLHIKRIAKAVPAHRLVLMHFKGNPPSENYECAHWDGNPLNNHISNLRWATKKENSDDSKRHGTAIKGESVASGKLKYGEVWLIKKLLKAKNEGLKISGAKIGKMFLVCRECISAIKTGRSWSHF